MRLAGIAGRFALFIAGMALLTVIGLFVSGAYLASWPIMRVSPRNRKLTSVMGMATAAMAVARAYELDTFMARKPNVTEDTEDTEDDPEDSPLGMHLSDFLNWLRIERGSYMTDTDKLTQAEVETLAREFLERG